MWVLLTPNTNATNATTQIAAAKTSITCSVVNARSEKRESFVKAGERETTYLSHYPRIRYSTTPIAVVLVTLIRFESFPRIFISP